MSGCDQKFNTIDELHEKYPWRSVVKFTALAKRYGFDEKEVKDFMSNNVIHDRKQKKVEYLPIFSKISGGYQMDTFIQKGGINYLMIININTRKAYAYIMNGKGKDEVIKALNKFFNEVKDVKSITSDQDAAYLSSDVLEYLKERNVSYHTTEDNNHNILGIINRFMRTIRDMNGYKGVINEERMNEMVKAYNDSPHRGIGGMSPNEMSKDKEEKYIEDKKKEIRQKEVKYNLHSGDRVRVMLEKKKIGKNRSNLSHESYIVDYKKGNMYAIRSVDGSVDNYPGYRLVKCGNDIPLAKTIKAGKRGIIDEILKYSEKTDRYKVKWVGGEEGWTASKNLRETAPLKLSDMEREYWVKQKNIPNEIRKWV